MNSFKQITKISLIALLILSCSADRHSFELFLEELETKPADQKQKMLQNFIKQNNWPMPEKETVYFIVQDSTHKSAYLTGDMCAWKPDSLQMEQISGTDFYVRKMDFPGDARVEYKYVLNGNYILDPLNPYTGKGEYGKNSALCMPAFVFEKTSLIQQKNHVSQIDTLQFKSRLLKDKRNIYIYRHPLATASSAIVLFHDGSDYLKFGSAQIILDNLIATERIPALCAVFIDPVDRQKEYWLNDNYLRAVFREMLPVVIDRYALNPESHIGMGGVSLGGLITLYALKDYSDELDFTFSQSSPLWVDSCKVLTELASCDSIKTHVYFDYGTFENMARVHSELVELMERKKIHFQINIFNEGHNWANWRAHLPLALTFGLKGIEK